MALIKCGECGKEISSMAESCPHCGARTQHGNKVEAEKSKDSSLAMGVIVISVIVIIVGAFLFFTAYQTMQSDTRYTYRAPLTDHEVGVLTQMFAGGAMAIGGVVTAIIGKFKA